MTDNRTTELRRLLDERGIVWMDVYRPAIFRTCWKKGDADVYCYFDEDKSTGLFELHISGYDFTPEQAIAATLGNKKVKAHPYGYEPDTGAFDVTRCECGCLNDVSATYCNDCGGIIEVDMDAEKEIYSSHKVSVTKHDDGSLEFDGKRYVAAILGGGKLTAEQVREAVMSADRWKKPMGNTELTNTHLIIRDDGWQAIADELNAALGCGECEFMPFKDEDWSEPNAVRGVCSECSALMYGKDNYCPNCGARIEVEK